MSAERRRLVKLVRSNVERFLGGDATVKYEPIPLRADYIDALRKKLIEEAVEYALNPSVDELADVYEVILTLAVRDLQKDMVAVGDARRRKRDERGGFDGQIGMYLNVAGEHDDPQAVLVICSECGGEGGLHWDTCSHRHDPIPPP